MAAVLGLLDTYGLADPVSDNPEGRFENADLQELYEQLAARSRSSLVEALRVGAEIEEIDILDIEEALAATSADDIAVVYSNLLRASENHLRAFTDNLESRGESYVPNHLSVERFTAIVEGPMQQGGRASGR